MNNGFKIDTGIPTIKTIIHISDIHIRNLKRHEEYRHVFNNFIAELNKEYSHDTILMITGDIAHAKTEMSPELIGLISEFLSSCAAVMPTFLITGNHDCNLNNTDRLDAISPIIRNMNNKNIHYLKDSGVYKVSNIDFAVYSRLDSKTLWPTINECNNEYNICLYHGVVNGATSDTGMKLQNPDITLSLFDGYDCGLFGDIHLKQTLQSYSNIGGVKKPTISYPSSLIQQNHGESLSDHGYLKWDLQTRTHSFHNIHNDWGFYTLKIKQGIVQDDSNIPAKPRIRIQLEDTPYSDVSRIIADIRKKYSVEYVSVSVKEDSHKSLITEYGESDSVIGDVFNISHQNEILRGYINSNFSNISPEVINEVIMINEKLNTEIIIEDLNRNIHWKLKRLEFSNMFKYGEENVINFNGLSDVVGLFSDNSAGKSSILQILLFALFDKCSKTNKAIEIVNINKSEFECLVQFEIENIDYFIKRIGKKQGGKNVFFPVTVDFWRKLPDGTIESLNGEQRRDTDKNISSYIGSYDNFILTAASLQENNLGFIEKGQSDRKNLMASFLGLDIFEKLYIAAKEKIKEVEIILKQFKQIDSSDELATAQLQIDENTELHEKNTNLLKEKKIILKKIRDMVNEFNRNIKPVDISNTSLSELNENKTKLEEDIQKLNDTIQRNQTEMDTLKSDTMVTFSKFKLYDLSDLQVRLEKLNTSEKNKNIIVNKLNSVKLDLKHKLEKLEKLENLEYDEECDYCMNNVFVKDAIDTKEKVKEVQEEIKQIELQAEEIDRSIKLNSGISSEIEDYNILKNEIETTKNKYTDLKNKNIINSTDLKIKESELQSVIDNIVKYHENVNIITKNNDYIDKIDKLKKKETDINKEIENISNELTIQHSNIKIAEKEKNIILAKIDRIGVLEKQFVAYDYYTQCMCKDGIPYSLITKVIPIFESHINNILSQITNFNVLLQLDDKNIDAYIVYENEKCWSLGLAGGMEKFMASLAIRSALNRISNIPKPNFLCVDEGFSVADRERIAEFPALFAFMANNYEFILIISHIDQMKECASTYLEIKPVSGYSYINNDL